MEVLGFTFYTGYINHVTEKRLSGVTSGITRYSYDSTYVHFYISNPEVMLIGYLITYKIQIKFDYIADED